MLHCLKAEQGYNLYIRWIARDAEQNQSFSSAGSMNAPTRPSSQCAEDIELDVRLGYVLHQNTLMER